MSGRVPEHIVQQIAKSTDLIGLVGSYCKLKQRGKKSWGLCPFHKENTASFSVDPEQGFYYCFGCKEGGDVFTFLKKMEGLEFHEALQKLADDAGVDLSQYRSEGAPSRSELDTLRDVNELAAAYYAKCLQKARGAEHARQYLKKRRINDESVERWRLGHAPDGWEYFLEFAGGRGYEPHMLVPAGLVVSRDGAQGHYDRFRNRLMFPVCDRRARTIGFGARALSEEDEPKYLNSPEGPLFSKGRCFYGLGEARAAIRAEKTAVIVEGYTDVIMAHQFGVESVMAVLGTALTESHAHGLRALCESVILVFDPDEAGQKSATRSIEVLLGEDLDVRVASLEPGEDPCAFLLSRGADEFRKRLEESVDFLEFRLRRAREDHDTTTVTGRARAFDELAEMALTVKNEARRDMLVRTMAGELGLGIESAMARVAHLWSQGRRTGQPVAARPDQGATPSRDEVLAFELLGFLLDKADCQSEACDKLHTTGMEECPGKRLLEQLLQRCIEKGRIEARDFVNSLDEPALKSLVWGAIAENQKREEAISNVTAVERLNSYCERLDEREQKRKKRELLTTMTAAPAATTTTIGATAAPMSEEDRLRAYEQLRRREDKMAARLNPGKGGDE